MVDRPRRMLRIAGRTLAILALVLGLALAGAWGALALNEQARLSPNGRMIVAALWATFTLAVAIAAIRRPRGRALLVYAAALSGMVLWWSTIAPSNDRDWEPEVAEMLRGMVSGTRVRLDNVRNFDWRTEGDFTPRWETREYDLAGVEAVDMILSYWGNPKIAHTLVSFGFAGGERVVFSVEIRKERGERFSEVGGFFKRFETSVVAADERDIVRVRTNARGEDVYLYRIDMPPQAMRSLFLAYVDEANELAAEPRFYNTVTANCTTIVFDMVDRIVAGLPIDRRLILSGMLPAYVEDAGGFVSDRPLAEITARGAISARGLAAGNSPDFSALIREGVPGY